MGCKWEDLAVNVMSVSRFHEEAGQCCLALWGGSRSEMEPVNAARCRGFANSTLITKMETGGIANKVYGVVAG